MSKVIIDAVAGVGVPDALSVGPYIDVNECFCEAFQGEGAYSGVPALFLRVAGCHVGMSVAGGAIQRRHGAGEYGFLYPIWCLSLIPTVWCSLWKEVIILW